MVNATTVTATFPALAAGTYNVTVTNSNGISGTVPFTYSPPPGLISLAPAVGTAAQPKAVTLTGTNFTAPGAGTTTVTVGTTAATIVVVVNATTVTATFPALAAGTYPVTVTNSHGTSGSISFVYMSAQTLAVTLDGSGSGAVSSSPSGISCGSDCSEAYTYGTTVTLSAVPGGTSAFVGWSGACTGSGTCTVNMDAAKTVTATFSTGISWTYLGLSGRTIQSLAIDPKIPTTLYAGDGTSGLLKSTDGGATWRTINTGLTVSTIRAIAVDPATPTTVYAGTGGGGIFKSIDGGGVWVPVNSGLANLTIQALAIDPTTPTTLYAGTLFGGVYKSTNGGATWSASGLASVTVAALAVDPVTPSTVYAAGKWGGTIYKSTNGGTTWNAAPGLPTSGYRGVVVDPTTPSTIYAVWASGVYKSGNGGADWASAGSGINTLDARSLAVDPTTPTILYLATADGVFQTDDGATSWYPLNHGLPSLDVSSIVVHPSVSGTLFAGAGATGAHALYQTAAPRALLRLSEATLLSGREWTASLSAVPAIGGGGGDLYAALQVPDGSFLFFQEGAGPSSTAAPFRAGWSGSSLTATVLVYTFAGTEAAGTYHWYAGVATAGTLDFPGGLTVVPMTYYPATSGPSVHLLPDRTGYRGGDAMQLNLVATPGSAAVDLYVALQFPDGSLLFVTQGGGVSSSMTPFRSGWTGGIIDQEVFRYAFGGGEPAGTYHWHAGITQMGTGTWVGPIVSTPFSFAP